MAGWNKKLWARKSIGLLAIYYLIGFGASSLIVPHASAINVFIGWVLAVTLTVLAAAYHPLAVAETKHILWTELAHQYAKKLQVEPRDVWIVDETEGNWLARAERDRIVVQWKVAQNYTEETMAFIIAHEVAHYVPSRIRYFSVASAIVIIAQSFFYATTPWWALPVVFATAVVLYRVIETLRTSCEEFRADRLAVQATSAQLALDTYSSFPTPAKLWFLRRQPSFYERRRAIISRLKSIDELESRANRVDFYAGKGPGDP